MADEGAVRAETQAQTEAVARRVAADRVIERMALLEAIKTDRLQYVMLYSPVNEREASMNRMIAYCGLVCSDCPAYIATQANDQAALLRVRDQWRQEYNAPDMAVDDVTCDGCLVGGLKCSHCADCDIRACGVSRAVANCAHCADYATCAKLERFFGFVPDAKAVLDQVRALL